MKKWISLNLPLIGLIITVIALSLSVRQLSDAKKITDSISTRYIGEFPEIVEQINDLLLQAKEEIIIMTDVLGYGMYSNPGDFHKYLSIIEKKAGDECDIKFVVYDNSLLKRTRQMQHIGFANIKEYHSLRKNQKHEEANNMRDSIFRTNLKEKELTLNNFFKYKFTYTHKSNNKRNFQEFDDIKSEFESRQVIGSISYNEFNNLLLDLNNSIQNRLVPIQHSVSITTTANQHVMNCWLIDRTKAIFGFVGNFNASEIAFYTQDRQIINYIISLVDNHLTDDPYGEYSDYEQ